MGSNGRDELGYGPREADREAERSHAEDIANGLVPGDDPIPVPGAGDAVRMLTPHKGMPELPPGSIGILNGMIGQPSEDGGASIMFRPRTYRDATVVSVSGGPGTIWTPYGELRPTGRTVTVQAWRFRDGHRAAGNGEDYTYQAALWDWCPGIPATQPIVTHSYTVTITVSDPAEWAGEYGIDAPEVAADVDSYWFDGLHHVIPDHQKPFTTAIVSRTR